MKFGLLKIFQSVMLIYDEKNTGRIVKIKTIKKLGEINKYPHNASLILFFANKDTRGDLSRFFFILLP